MGKSALILVMGFSFLFFLQGQNYYTANTEAFRNAMSYYDSTAIHEIALAGANMACTEVYREPSWRTGFSNISYNGGVFNVTAVNTGSSQRVQITSTATLNEQNYSIAIVIGPRSFSQYAYWGTGVSGGGGQVYWETGDTVTGPMHTQGTLRTTGAPTFLGRTTALNGINSINTSPSGPVFGSSFQSGLSIPLVSGSLGKLDSTATANGYRLNATGGANLYIVFNANGTVTVRQPLATSTPITQPLSTFAPNGVISINNGNIYVEGTVNGQVTILANKSSGTVGGTVNITGNLTYASDPRTDPTQTSMLGIVAQNDIVIRDNSATQFTVMGSIYSATTGLVVQNLSTRPAGNLTLVGGLIGPILYATSNGGTGSGRRGYNLGIRYDTRFMNDAPPFYPTTGTYQILSWYE
ncbi:MAG TPA: hypothetical protein VK470_01415 [Bacteroidota bacterium]|nr:hypothetical protein [Bacteroidota bacterium]